MSTAFRDRITPEMAERLYELIGGCATCESSGGTLSIHGNEGQIGEINLLIHGHDTLMHREKATDFLRIPGRPAARSTIQKRGPQRLR